MISRAHEIVRRLLALAALDQRLATLKHDGKAATNVAALIESLRANIPPGVLLAHDRMRGRERRCVAEVRHGVCGGCHLALARGNIAAVRQGELYRCGNCGRYLYLGEEEAPAEAASAKVVSIPHALAKTASHGQKN